MKKLLTALTITIITLTTLLLSSYSYAGTKSNPTFDLAFTNVTTSDNEAEIDVATTFAEIAPDGNTIKIYILNAYPCYEAYTTYTIQNKGKKPARFDSLSISNPNPEALKITTTDHTYTWLQPGQTVQGTTTIHILPTAKENQQYTFQITLGISNREEKPRTIGFWRKQFSAALNQIESQQQLATVTLENYFNQITSQSKIFKFTGTQEEKFQQALNTLNPSTSNTENQLKAQLLALWLNYVASWTQGYTLKGMTAWDIIQGSENALSNQQTNKYEYWKNLCDQFNNLGK